MNQKRKLLFAVSLFAIAAFALWTLAVKFIDVRAVGPQGSSVGFAKLNTWFHGLTGVHTPLYVITDWLGLVPFFFAAGFGVLGLCQWIKRKSIVSVDRSILLLGGFYVTVITFYLLFEEVVINYRPVLINGYLEASYPSSTTLLTLTVMTTAIFQLKNRISSPALSKTVCGITAVFTAFTVVGRLIAGVHWLTDIIGGILLSAGLVLLYFALCCGKNHSL